MTRAGSMLACVRALAMLAALMARPSVADANGRFPASQFVVVSADARHIALRTSFGVMLSHDGGAHFHWLCEEALGYGGVYDPPIALLESGSIVIGLSDGAASTTDGCSVPAVPSLRGLAVADVTVDPTGHRVYAVTGGLGAGIRNRVHLSDDTGTSFVALGDGVPDLAFDTIEVVAVPGRTAARVYATGVTTLGSRTPVFLRSDDGGATLTPMPDAVFAGAVAVYLAGVDPIDPDVIYVRGVLAAGGSMLARSDDGGAHFAVIARATGVLAGFASSDDGATVWIGGPDRALGLQRSDDRGAHWSRIADVGVHCLRQRAGTLYICAEQDVDGYALGRSTNRGDTITPLLRLCDVAGAFTCPEGTAENDICDLRWATVTTTPGIACRPQMRIDAGSPGLDVPGVSIDSGPIDAMHAEASDVIGAPGTESRTAIAVDAVGGCAACSAQPGRAPQRTDATGWMTLALSVLLVRSRRRSARLSDRRRASGSNPTRIDRRGRQCHQALAPR